MPKKTVAGGEADPTVRFAKLHIDGKTYSLAFDFNALAIAESMTGVNLMQALRALDNLSVSQTRGLLYASLLKAHSKMTVAEVGSLLHFKTIPLITDALSEAITNSMPDAETEENPQQPEPSPADH